MITLQNVTKSYPAGDGRKVVLDNVSAVFPDGTNIGILGRNGSGKSTMIRLLSGAELPNKGHIKRQGRVSFPMGFGGTFAHRLSARENIVFLARVYGMPIHQSVEFVQDFAEIGHYFDMPMHTYSSGMRARLMFAASLAIDFDFYLIDEITEVGDSRFREKAVMAFRERIRKSSIILVSHNYHTMRDICQVGAILGNGRLDFYRSLEEAITVYETMP